MGGLLERDELLHVLCGHLEDAEGGGGRLVLIHGEAGIGKTAIVRRFAALAASTARFLVGSCDPLSTPRPLGPLVDVAGDLGPDMEQALEQALGGSGSVSGVFSRLLGELRREPVVVVFEDVHWADEATLDVLRYLARRIDRTPSLLVATYRDDELGVTHPLAVMLGDVATCPAVQRCAVGPLSRQAVARLVAGRRVDLDELCRVTGGNPFFVTEFLATDGEGIPATVREAVTGRLARLSAPARAAAETLAVLGAAAPPELLAVLVPDAEAALEEALAGGVLQVDGPLVAFRHELARRAVYDTIPAPRRSRLHGQVLAALRSGAVATDCLNSLDSPARLASHAEEANDAEAVCTYAVAAAMQAMALRAHREAAAQCERALRYADALPTDQRLALLVGRSFARYCTGPMTEAIAAREAALELRRVLGDRLGEAQDLFTLAHMMRVAGRSERGLALGLDSLRALEGLEPSRQLAGAHLTLAELAVLRHDYAQTEIHVGQARTLADRLGAPAISVQARFHAATARLIRTGEGWEELEAVRSLAIEISPEQNVGQIAAIMAYVATVHRDFAHAIPATDWAIDYCVDHDLTLLGRAVQGFSAYGLLHRGHWTQAAELASAVLGHPDLPPALQVLPMVVVAMVWARRGEAGPWPLLDQALSLVEPSELLLSHVWQARSEAAWLAGDDARVEAEAHDGLKPVLALQDPDPWMAGGLARWLLISGGVAPPDVPAAPPFAGELARNWATAATAWDSLGCPYDAALARLGGDAAALRHAVAAFEALGAEPAAVRTRQRMRALGMSRRTRGPHASTRANPHRLTKRELEVANLLREELSDAEIAARLVITTKTASSHVSAILAKLGVHTRHQAARRLG